MATTFDHGKHVLQQVLAAVQQPEEVNGYSGERLQVGALISIACFLEVLATPPVESEDSQLKLELVRLITQREQELLEARTALRQRTEAHEQSLAREDHWRSEYTSLKEALSPDGLKERLEVLVQVERTQREARVHLEKEVQYVVNFFEKFMIEDQGGLGETLKANSDRFYGGLGYEEGDEAAPFFSEAVLYTLVGKEDARTILALMRRLKDGLKNHIRIAEGKKPDPVAWGHDID